MIACSETRPASKIDTLCLSYQSKPPFLGVAEFARALAVIELYDAHKDQLFTALLLVQLRFTTNV